MTTQQLDLSYQELVYLEQALAEGIDKYDEIVRQHTNDPRFITVIVNCRDKWKEMLAKTTLLYPEHPRSWFNS